MSLLNVPFFPVNMYILRKICGPGSEFIVVDYCSGFPLFPLKPDLNVTSGAPAETFLDSKVLTWN